jgi:hypothetical protein
MNFGRAQVQGEVVVKVNDSNNQPLSQSITNLAWVGAPSPRQSTHGRP